MVAGEGGFAPLTMLLESDRKRAVVCPSNCWTESLIATLFFLLRALERVWKNLAVRALAY